ncbi:MAG: hypothetical protein AUF67_15005 [Acidobacteria bacterium 13_1_20CM_58_21]|nr:MAG: hypothetical protein AUF67_15005 [Acidobacteria bacterium 13_1_20CM_58_21]
MVLWVAELIVTWGAWGNLTIDSGHEMYVPALLAEGKTLYRDTWFMYGPAGPYFVAYLFRLFGIHLTVLYWAGALSALVSSVMLYVTGMYLSSWLMGWTAGAVLLVEAFAPSLFCFPLPYSFSAVYGCTLGCIFLYVVIRASDSRGWWWIFWAGLLAGIEVLMKPEFGLACYVTLLSLLLVRWLQQRSARLLATDVGATLPGIVGCAVVIRWMISIGGAEFLTQENLITWPTSYFMKTFGKMRLERTGFSLTAAAFEESLWRAFGLGLALLVVYAGFWRRDKSRHWLLVRTALYFITAFYFVRFFLGYGDPDPLLNTLSLVFFPRDMVIYIGFAAPLVFWQWWTKRSGGKFSISAGLPILLIYSSTLAFRILMRMIPSEYAIYYNGPVVLSFLLLLRCIVPHTKLSRRYALLGEVALCAGCLALVGIPAVKQEYFAKDYVPLVTSRGTVRLNKAMKQNYEAAIQFMKEKTARGQTVLSVPEDTSLYFLAETECPIRVYSLTPGVIAPGKMMNEVIQEIDTKRVDYLLWSNRVFVEYGVPVFGKDFDRELANYLKTHYRRIGPVRPLDIGSLQWTAVVWERNPPEPLP